MGRKGGHATDGGLGMRRAVCLAEVWCEQGDPKRGSRQEEQQVLAADGTALTTFTARAMCCSTDASILLSPQNKAAPGNPVPATPYLLGPKPTGKLQRGKSKKLLKTSPPPTENSPAMTASMVGSNWLGVGVWWGRGCFFLEIRQRHQPSGWDTRGVMNVRSSHQM